eukprot:TRINITY_DN3435_c0_g2_i2.p1 TRINITY_DN3435_c0_g2~~TRINITY_DN3435_c0_g2_i2.p1  ORF type:complete len:387 (+),score=85.96 TRINITY_DN3435_c0_g2_i2:123-1283(+)
MIRRPPRSTLSSSSAASDVYKRQVSTQSTGILVLLMSTSPRRSCCHPTRVLMTIATKACLIKHKSVPQWVKFALVHLLSRVTCYWLPNLVLHLMQVSGIGAQWRIQGKRMPNPALASKAIRHNIMTDVIGYWGVAWFFNKLLTTGGNKKHRGNLGDTRVEVQVPLGAKEGDELTVSLPSGEGKYSVKVPAGVVPGDTFPATTPAARQGWSCLRFGGDWPSWFTQLWQVSVGYLGYDMMFYWSHRLLHHRAIYKHIHKVHHEFHTPIGPSSSYEHPAESTAQLFNWYLPIGFAGWLNKELHWSTLLLYNCFRWIETVDAHSGYELPFSLFNLVPVFGSATMHDYHHRAVLGNYGASTFWDWLCSTNSGYWEEVLEDGFLRGGKFVKP